MTEPQVINGVQLPDDEGKIILPTGYSDPMIVREHLATIGENVVTCILTVTDPAKKVGEVITCGKCGQKFTIVEQNAPETK